MTDDDKFAVHYGGSSRDYRPFFFECIRAAINIGCSANNWDKPISVLLSGGIDSEVVARSFLHANIPFKCYITQFNDNLNLHDISYAVSFCESHQVKYELIPLNINEFLDVNDSIGTAYAYAVASQCCSPQLPSILWLADQVPGIPVIGSGECLLERRHHSEAAWYLQEQEKVASLYKYFVNGAGRTQLAIPGFFQYSPELMLSYLKDPLVVERMKTDKSSYDFKFDVYKKHFPGLVKRKKYTGFENVRQLDQQVRQELEKRFKNDIVQTSYSKLIKMLS